MSVEGQLGTDRVFAAELQALRPHPGPGRLGRQPDRAARRTPASSPPPRAGLQPGPGRLLAALLAAGARRRPRHRRARRAGRRPRAGLARSTTRWCSTTAGSSPTATSTAPRSPTCSTSWRSSPPTSPRSAERRTDRFLDRARNHGLPPFLADDPGVDSGHMIAQYTQAAIVSELKRLAVPASVDSIPSQRDAGGPRLDGLVGRPQAAPLRRRADPGGRDRGAHRGPRARPARARWSRRRPPAPSSRCCAPPASRAPGPTATSSPEIEAAVELRRVAAPSCTPSKTVIGELA